MNKKTDKLTEEETAPVFPLLLWNLLKQFASYRSGMRIKEAMILGDGYVYYCCPRCEVTLDREFVSFCDRCGQKLDWAKYGRAKLKGKTEKTQKYIYAEL